LLHGLVAPTEAKRHRHGRLYSTVSLRNIGNPTKKYFIILATEGQAVCRAGWAVSY